MKQPDITLRRELTGRILDLGGGVEGIIGRVYGPQVIAIDPAGGAGRSTGRL